MFQFRIVTFAAIAAGILSVPNVSINDAWGWKVEVNLDYVIVDKEIMKKIL